MANEYKLEGRGDSPQAAEKALETNQSALVAKLKKAKVAEDVKVVRERFVADFTLKKDMKPTDVDAASFRVESDQDWQTIEERRQRLADGGQYDGKFTAERYLELTGDQEAATRETKQTSAGPSDYIARSALRMPPRL
jgi:hypothetical protein